MGAQTLQESTPAGVEQDITEGMRWGEAEQQTALLLDEILSGIFFYNFFSHSQYIEIQLISMY